jgi:hypothetical protein
LRGIILANFHTAIPPETLPFITAILCFYTFINEISFGVKLHEAIIAGGVIHSMGDSQDIRFMGDMSSYMLLLLRV